jgi:hypothetical protein
MQNKIVISDKVTRPEKNNNRKFKIDKDKSSESEVMVEVVEEGQYTVEKLSVEGLPEKMHDGNTIDWLNNFGIKKAGQYINQRYKVTISGISGKQLVIYDGNGDPYYYTGKVENDTFELTDGDPAIGTVR